MTDNFKVESGLQLLARLTKKKTLENFYPTLFTNGPNFQEVVELIGDPGAGKSLLLSDLIAQALIPEKLGGTESAVLIYNTDGNISLQVIYQLLLGKLHRFIQASNQSNVDINCLLKESLQRLHIVDTFDGTQFYVTIQNLETYLIKYPQISLVALDTLTAYYWSEQSTKIIKMSTHIKNMLKLVHKVTKEFKVAIIYTRQYYFKSSRDLTDLENINYRIHIQRDNSNNSTFEATIMTKNYQNNKQFKIVNSELEWVLAE